MFLVNPEDHNSGEYVLAGCWACHGTGARSALLIRRSSDKALEAANAKAVRVILRELERRLA